MNWDLMSVGSAVVVALFTCAAVFFSYQSGKIKDQELDKARGKLIETQQKLLSKSDILNEAQNQLKNVQDRLLNKSDALIVAQEKLTNSQEELLIKSQSLINSQNELLKYTHGDGYCHIDLMNINNDSPFIVAINKGNYPIYDVTLTIIDLNYIEEAENQGLKTIDDNDFISQKQIGTIQKHEAVEVGNFTLKADNVKLGFIISTRNSSTYQRTVFSKHKDKWISAYIITDIKTKPWKDLDKIIPAAFLELDPNFKFPDIYLPQIKG